MIGRTLTRHFHIETRQHEVFNIDLGEGVPRRMLMLGVVVTLAWVALMAPIVGVPNRFTFSFYVLPPVLLAYFGFQEDAHQPRRRNLTTWAIRSRYATVGHRPIIGLGSRAAYRSEYVPLDRRLPLEGLVRRIAPWALPPEWEQSTDTSNDAGPIQTGRPIALAQTATVYGFDRMQAMRRKR